MSKNINPPKFANRLLSFFLKGKENSEKLGDLEEGFWIKAEEEGIIKAKLWYWRQTLIAIPVCLKNSITWRGIMFKNYFKIAIRNIKKYKTYSTINIMGLAVGMACSIFIMLWVNDELSYDNFHTNGNDIYRILPTVSGDTWTSSPWALIDNLKRDYPEIKKGSWFFPRIVNTKYQESAFNERIALVAPDFLKMFTFPIIVGNPNTALSDVNSIIISEQTALKYFGNEDPLGKVITIDDQIDLTVTGIIENVPTNSTLQFDMLARPEIAISQKRLHGWSMDCASYIMLSEGTNYKDVVAKISDSVERYDKRGLYECTIDLQPLRDVYLINLDGTDPIVYVYIFTAIAVLVILIASINFTNLSTARSALRAKEIGMRKVIGAKRGDVIKQFFSESILLSFIALFIAIFIVFLLLPSFNTITEKQLSSVDLLNPQIVFSLILVALLTGLLSGIYPSLYLSSFQPVTILKNAMAGGGKKHFLRRALIIFQFSAALCLIISTGIILKQIDYIKNKDLGFNRENVVTVNLDDTLLGKYELLKEKLRGNRNIINITAASNLPLNTNNNDMVRWEGYSGDDPQMFNFVSVDYNYFQTLEMKLKYGRAFSIEHSTDKDNYVINETAAKIMGFENPVGKKFFDGGYEGTIIGVVKDFHGTSFRNQIRPTFFMMRYYDVLPKSRMFVRVGRENIHATMAFIQDKCEQFSPEFIFNYRFLDDYFNQIYTSEEHMRTLLEYFAILAIFISCLGLLGLASFMAERRKKEIAIRKVLGAKVISLVFQLSKEFAMLVLLSNLIAWPIAYYFMNKWIDGFTYRTDIGITIFVFAAVGALAIALLTVSFQALKATNANPIDSIKHE